MIAELERLYRHIGELQREREQLLLALLRYAKANRDFELSQFLFEELRQFSLSVDKMNKTYKDAEDTRARELKDFDELHDYLVHALTLEQLALREAAFHEAYLVKTIKQLRAKSQQLELSKSG